MKKLLAGFMILFCSLVFAGREPCSGSKGGIAYCEGDSFVCKDGSYSNSTSQCPVTQYGNKPSKIASISNSSKPSKVSNKKQQDTSNVVDNKVYGKPLTTNDLSIQDTVKRLNAILKKSGFDDSELVALPANLDRKRVQEQDFYNLNFYTMVFSEYNFHVDMLNQKVIKFNFYVRDDAIKENMHNAALVISAVMKSFLPSITEKQLTAITKKMVLNGKKSTYEANNIIFTYKYNYEEKNSMFREDFTVDLSKINNDDKEVEFK